MPLSFYPTQEEREMVELEIEETMDFLMENDRYKLNSRSEESLCSLCEVLTDSLFEKTQRLGFMSPIVSFIDAVIKLIFYPIFGVMVVGFLAVCLKGLSMLPFFRTLTFILLCVQMILVTTAMVLNLMQRMRELKMFNIIAMLRILREEFLISSEQAEFNEEVACKVIAASKFEVVSKESLNVNLNNLDDEPDEESDDDQVNEDADNDDSHDEEQPSDDGD